MATKGPRVYLTRGLEGRDQHIDLLSQLFEESQVVTIETANPALDLLSFAQDCTSFWVINAVNTPAPVGQTISVDDFPDEHNNLLGLFPSIALERTNMDAAVENTTNSDTHAQIPFTDRMGELSQAKHIAGFAYLVPSSPYQDPLHYQEHSVGIILRPKWRGRGVGEKALHYALDIAFSRPDVHRAQAQLIDCYKNDKALRLFTRMGFSHEGTRRQGFHCPLTQEWKDVTTLAMLVTDWVVRVRDDKLEFRGAPKSLWDALFARHQREREELLRWEEKRPRRSSSLDTIRDEDRSATPVQELSEAETDAETGSVVSEREGKGKRKLFDIGGGTAAKAGDAYDASSSEYESDYESCVDGSPPKRIRSHQPGPLESGQEKFEINWHTWRPSRPTMPDESEDPITGSELEIPATQNLVILRPSLNSIPLPELPAHDQDDACSACDTDNWETQSPADSPSPETREGSLVSVPPSESESESDYTSSSTTSNWEMV